MKPMIVFSHGNGFPAGTYGVLLHELQARGFEVCAIDRFGHDAQYPVTDNWPHLVQQLVDFVETQTRRAGEPAYLVGHSLGGLLSLMAAAQRPDLARGVVLIDSPIIGGWRATTLGVIKRTPIVSSFSPGAVSRKRRYHWPDRDAALAHFQHKKAFARWDAQVLQDYIDHGTREELTPQGARRRVLCFERDVETHIYNTVPHHLEALLRRHPLKCPVAFIGGIHSLEMKRGGMALTDRLIRQRKMMLDGGHLIPMEKPRATAAAVEASVLNLMGRI